MHYKIKSLITNIISLLPGNFSFYLYSFLQNKFGAVNYDFIKILLRGKKIIKILNQIGVDFKDKTFLELGTGKLPILPISLYLNGAKEIVTIDLYTFFSLDAWDQFFNWIGQNKNILIKEFPDLRKDRLELLLACPKSREKSKILSYLSSIGVKYLAPLDARDVSFKKGYFNFFISFNVLEHIPSEDIVDILKKIKKVISIDGIYLHRIDFTDHFAHSDRNISLINFLRFSKKNFSFLSHNKFMYMNRMRSDDFKNLFKKLKIKVIYSEESSNNLLKELLNINDKSVQLHEDFKSKSIECLSTTDAWYGFIFN